MLDVTLKKFAVSCGLTTLFLTLPGMAQFNRTWVSRNGNDVHDCSINHPCRTFQRAHNQTNAYGEVDVLDPADYGDVTITHPITIDGGNMGYIMGQPAIRVNTFDVNLRNLSLIEETGRPHGPNDWGIVWAGGGFLDVDAVSIDGFGGAGIQVQPAASTVARRLYVKNSTIRECGNGIVLPLAIVSSTGVGGVPVRAVIDHTFLHGVDDGTKPYGVGEGIVVPSGVAQVIHSVIVEFSTAVTVGSIGDRPSTAEVNLEDSTLSYAFQGVAVFGTTTVVRMAEDNIHDNANALVSVAGGQIVSFGNNRIAGNGAAENPTSTIALK